MASATAVAIAGGFAIEAGGVTTAVAGFASAEGDVADAGSNEGVAAIAAGGDVASAS